IGLFTQTITLTGFSFNADDLLGIGTNATLFVRANVIDPGTSVIPLPPAGFLLLGGLAVMGWMGRRRRT
ncbi:MAG: VPLPA-CTERM sorting domain-containing protein, partial [Betaproteobacteria bacterium]|nr:VPLPA-CTERM sorting domain-containing protein [Betaproteobacteria bacterium]